jgi:hypothetical protein
MERKHTVTPALEKREREENYYIHIFLKELGYEGMVMNWLRIA